MQKMKWILMLVVVCICITSIPSIAQIPTANWPRFQRDAYNSGRSIATNVAKPVLKWQRTLTIDPACSAAAWSDIAKCGIIVDPDGNVVVSCSRPWSLAKFNSAGVLQWNTTIPTICVPGDNNYDSMLGGPAVTGTSSGYSYIAGPGFDASGTGSNLYMYDIDASAGSYVWRVNLAYKPNSWNRYCSGTPSVASNGEIYFTTAYSGYGDLSGVVQAVNPTTMSRDWTYGNSQNGGNYSNLLQNGVGPEVGACIAVPMTSPNAPFNGQTKNVIFRGGGWIYTWAVTDTSYSKHKSFMALADNGPGVAPTLLWRGTPGFHRSQPVMSNDGSKIYIAGYDQWYDNGSATDHPAKVLSAYLSTPDTTTYDTIDATYGTYRSTVWQLDLPVSCLFSPAVGADGTLYVSGSAIDPIPTNNNGSRVRYNPSGRLIAVQDNGTSATIKWTLDMPGELGADMSNVVTISNTSHKIIYVAAGKGHVYCVEDLGDHPKILWEYNANISNYIQPNGYNISCGTNRPIGSYNIPIPGSLALADDGTLYAGWADQLLAFDTGYSTSQSYGISGTVTDASGNPIAGAMVSVSKSDHPLIDNADGIYTTTNSDGTYQVSIGGVSSSTTYYVASWKEGYAGTDAQTVSLSSETSSATANFTLNSAKFNWALCATASTNNANTGSLASSYTASKATDGSYSTWFQTDAETTANFIKNKPTYLMVDLGQDRSISEATVYWTYASAQSYSIDYLPDGQDPATGTWTNVYSTTTGNGGYPTYWTSNALSNGGSIATVPANSGTGTMKALVKMPYTGAADTIKLPAISARYWRVYATAASGNAYTQPQAYSGDLKTAQYIGISEVVLRDPSIAAQPLTLAGAKNTPDGGGAIISSAVVTAMPGAGLSTGNICIETADRSAGIRVDASGVSGLDFTKIGIGDKVSVVGKVYTSNGEKYIAATSVTRLSSGQPVVALGINNRDIATDKGQGLLVKTWGNVTTSDGTSFTITDGSSNAIKVLCGSITKPSNGSMVKVRGVAGKDASGTVLYMRNEPVDSIDGNAEYQPLPLPGPYKYPREYAVCGPFADATSATDEAYRLSHDFISDATGGALTETTIQPNLGDACGDKTWIRGDASSDTLSFTSVYPSNNTKCTFYAHLWIYSASAQYPGMRLGSDDGISVWVNGSPVWTAAGPRGLAVGGDYVQFITLNAGFNSVLFKVENNTASCSLMSQIIDESVTASNPGYGASMPLLNLGYALSKPAGL